MEAKVKTLNAHTEQQQMAVTLTEDGLTFIAIKFVPKDDMYHKGLQKNYVDTVNMLDVAEIVTDTINVYSRADMLNEDTWGKIHAAFASFTASTRSWDNIQAVLEGAKWD